MSFATASLSTGGGGGGVTGTAASSSSGMASPPAGGAHSTLSSSSSSGALRQTLDDVALRPEGIRLADPVGLYSAAFLADSLDTYLSFALSSLDIVKHDLLDVGFTFLLFTVLELLISTEGPGSGSAGDPGPETAKQLLQRYRHMYAASHGDVLQALSLLSDPSTQLYRELDGGMGAAVAAAGSQTVQALAAAKRKQREERIFSMLRGSRVPFLASLGAGTAGAGAIESMSAAFASWNGAMIKQGEKERRPVLQQDLAARLLDQGPSGRGKVSVSVSSFSAELLLEFLTRKRLLFFQGVLNDRVRLLISRSLSAKAAFSSAFVEGAAAAPSASSSSSTVVFPVPAADAVAGALKAADRLRGQQPEGAPAGYRPAVQWGVHSTLTSQPATQQQQQQGSSSSSSDSADAASSSLSSSIRQTAYSGTPVAAVPLPSYAGSAFERSLIASAAGTASRYRKLLAFEKEDRSRMGLLQEGGAAAAAAEGKTAKALSGSKRAHAESSGSSSSPGQGSLPGEVKKTIANLARQALHSPVTLKAHRLRVHAQATVEGAAATAAALAAAQSASASASSWGRGGAGQRQSQAMQQAQLQHQQQILQQAALIPPALIQCTAVSIYEPVTVEEQQLAAVTAGKARAGGPGAGASAGKSSSKHSSQQQQQPEDSLSEPAADVEGISSVTAIGLSDGTVRVWVKACIEVGTPSTAPKLQQAGGEREGQQQQTQQQLSGSFKHWLTVELSSTQDGASTAAGILSLAISPCRCFLLAGSLDGRIRLFHLLPALQTELRAAAASMEREGYVPVLPAAMRMGERERQAALDLAAAAASVSASSAPSSSSAVTTSSTLSNTAAGLPARDSSSSSSSLSSSASPSPLLPPADPKLKPLATYDCHRGMPVWGLAFCPLSSGVFASCGRDMCGYIWSTASREPQKILAGHLSDVDCIAFHPNGLYLLTGSGDKTARVWECSTGDCVGLLLGHSAGLSSIAVSPAGRFLASGDAAGEVRLWDLPTGACFCRLRGHSSDSLVTSLAFDASGHWLCSADMDGRICGWDVPAVHASAAPVEAVLAQGLAGMTATVGSGLPGAAAGGAAVASGSGGLTGAAGLGAGGAGGGGLLGAGGAGGLSGLNTAESPADRQQSPLLHQLLQPPLRTDTAFVSQPEELAVHCLYLQRAHRLTSLFNDRGRVVQAASAGGGGGGGGGDAGAGGFASTLHVQAYGPSL